MHRIRTQIWAFILNQRSFSTLFFFLQILYLHIFGPLQNSAVFLFLAVIFAIVLRQNYFWYVGIVISPGLGFLEIINYKFAIISCTERWKVLMFAYVLGDIHSLPYPNLNIFYNGLAILGILYEIYVHLPLRDVEQNIYCFVLFSCFWLYQISLYVIPRFQIAPEQQLYVMCLVIGVGVLAAYFLIYANVKNILNHKIQHLERPDHFLHYIRTTKQKSNEILERIGIQKIHKLSCADLDCFCKKTEQKLSFCRLYLRYLYERGVIKFKGTIYEEELEQFYISHLIDQKMFPLAVQNFIKLKVKKWDVFKLIRIQKVKLALKNQLTKLEQTYQNRLIDNPFAYEQNYERLKRQIIQLIELKIKYWAEVNRSNAKVLQLKQLGQQFLKKLNKMNNFYHEEISPIEKQLRLFAGSVIYNLFLLIATNYKDLAETNMKNLKKMTDSGVTTEERKNFKIYLIKVGLSADKFSIIQNVNKHFSTLLNCTKDRSEYIGVDMNFLIPPCYQKQHLRGMQELRKYNMNKNLGVEIDPIFLLTATNNIVPSSLVVKYSVDIFNELCIIGFIKRIKNENEYMLVNLQDGLLHTTSDKISDDILESSNMKSSLANFKAKWKNVDEQHPNYHIIEPVKIQLKFKQSSYTCMISSPLCGSFRYPETPPIHLSIHNETQTYFVDNDIVDQADLAGCMKKINNIIDQAETQSQASNISRRNEVISILKNFENNASFPIFNRLLFLLIVILVVGVSLQSILYFSVGLTWINPSVENGNQFTLLKSIYEAQYLMNKVIGKGLAISGINAGIIANTDYSNIYGVADYLIQAGVDIGNTCDSLKQLVSVNAILEQTSMGSDYISAVTQQIPVTTSLSQQNFSFHSLLRIFISDCYELPKGWLLQNRVSGQVYWQSIFTQYYNIITIVKNFMFSELDSYGYLNIILAIGFSIFLAFFIIPILFIGNSLERQEDYIYELMISIQPSLISKEITELVQLELNLRNNSQDSFLQQATYALPHNSADQEEEKTQLQKSSLDNSKKRKRNGELQKNKEYTPRLVFTFSILYSILMIMSLFAIKFNLISNITTNINTSISIKEWRNQRLALLVNMKKLIFNYNVNQSIMGTNLNSWISSTINYRKSNFLANGSTDSYVLCNTTNPLCSNLTLNTEVGLNVFFDTIISENYQDLSPFKLPEEEITEQLLFAINANQEPNFIQSVNSGINTSFNQETLVYVIAWLGCLVLFLVNYWYVNKLKRQYIDLTKTVTFLSEEMIKKTKRVESFLQRLSKNS